MTSGQRNIVQTKDILVKSRNLRCYFVLARRNSVFDELVTNLFTFIQVSRSELDRPRVRDHVITLEMSLRFWGSAEPH